MARKRLGAEQIVTKLRQIEVLQGQGKSVAAACKEAGTTEQSYYRWRREYGGLSVDQARRLKQLENENGRLKKLVADLSLEKQVLKDIAEGNLFSIRGALRKLLLYRCTTSVICPARLLLLFEVGAWPPS